MLCWPATEAARRLRVSYPIIQGPFGGGPSTVELVAAVSNAGGLGSFGAYGLSAEQIEEVTGEIAQSTPASFAVNLWVGTHDIPESEMSSEQFEEAVARLQPLYEKFGVRAPQYPERFAPSFDEQVEALLRARPPVASFVFGIPEQPVLQACREAGIVTIATASSVEEAVAIDQVGADLIVASGMEAGGHRVSFLHDAESALTGSMALIPLIADNVRAPVIAAGGIADARGVLAALHLGAQGVQIGTAFLVTDESGAADEHKSELLDARATQLTRAFTGRLARGVPNTLMRAVESGAAILPFPYQGYLLGPLLARAQAEGDPELSKLWGGQAAGLARRRSAGDLVESLIRDVSDALPAGDEHQQLSASALARWTNEGGALGSPSDYWSVCDDIPKQQLQLRARGRLAGSLSYQLRGRLLALEHTNVFPEFQGQGAARRLAESAMERAERDELMVLPLCRYTSRYIAEHPEHLLRVPAELRVEFDLPPC